MTADCACGCPGGSEEGVRVPEAKVPCGRAASRAWEQSWVLHKSMIKLLLFSRLKMEAGGLPALQS